MAKILINDIQNVLPTFNPNRRKEEEAVYRRDCETDLNFDKRETATLLPFTTLTQSKGSVTISFYKKPTLLSSRRRFSKIKVSLS